MAVQENISAVHVRVVRATTSAYGRRKRGTRGSSAAVLVEGMQTHSAEVEEDEITSEQRWDSPKCHRHLVKQLKPPVDLKPSRWIDEELVGVGVDVEASEVGDKGRRHCLGVETAEVHDCVC